MFISTSWSTRLSATKAEEGRVDDVILDVPQGLYRVSIPVNIYIYPESVYKTRENKQLWRDVATLVTR